MRARDHGSQTWYLGQQVTDLKRDLAVRDAHNERLTRENAELRSLIGELLTCASYTPGHVTEDIVRRASVVARG